MFLIDTSALIRMQREQVDPAWDELGDRGLLAVCEPVLAETLMIADAKDYGRVEERIRLQHPWVTVPAARGRGLRDHRAIRARAPAAPGQRWPRLRSASHSSFVTERFRIVLAPIRIETITEPLRIDLTGEPCNPSTPAI